VLTFNEAPNIARCLERLAWARRVVVLDSGSTDDTVALANRFPNVDVHTRPFDDYASQRNHGLGLITTPWVLSLDADYLLPEAFLPALDRILLAGDLDAVVAGFRYCVFGRPLRASLYPPRPVLFRRDRCRYEADGHSETLLVGGRSASTPVRIDHDDRKSIDRWFASQMAYARLEAEKLASRAPAELNWQDRMRRTMLLGPPGACVYALLVKGALFDGWPGWYYALQRAIAEMLLSLQLLDRRLRR
jgi:glycosyltransferase involved in cell wall biosynthesis